MKGIKIGKLLWGCAIMLLGLLLLGNTLGFASWTIWQGFGILWPIGLIVAGLAIIMRMKVLASVIFALTLVFAIMHLLTSIGALEGETRYVKLEAPYEGSVEKGTFSIKYGAGDLKIDHGSDFSFLSADVQTTDTNDPILDVVRTSKEVEVSLERSSAKGIPWGQSNEAWDVHLTGKIPITLDIDYGATDAEIDMRKLKVSRLYIDGGVTDAKVIFGEYPTIGDIDVGVTSIDLYFPESAGVIIRVDGGILDINFDEFYQNDKTYFSKDYEKKSYTIELDISAGVTDLNAQFYNEGDDI